MDSKENECLAVTATDNEETAGKHVRLQIEAKPTASDHSSESSEANGAGIGTVTVTGMNMDMSTDSENENAPHSLCIVEIESPHDRSGGGGVIADEMNATCQLPGERVKNVGFLQVNNQAECLPVKSLDLTLKPIVAAQALEPSASCSGRMTATEAALIAATISTALGRPDAKQQFDIQTQYDSLEIDRAPTPSDSMPSLGSLVCRICHNADNPEQLVSPCLCKGSLTYVHIHCLERWISTSRCTTCELCQFTYNTEQTLRYTCMQSLRMWYSRAMSRRALQEDCQMFSLLTLVAFGIVGTLLVGIQYYALHTQTWGLSKLWTKSWMLFFLFITITVYFANVYMLIKSQLTPWYRWWQSARDIKLILENRRPFRNPSKAREDASVMSMYTHHDIHEIELQQEQQQPPEAPGASPSPPQAPIHANMVTAPMRSYMDLHNVMLNNHLQLLKEHSSQPNDLKNPTAEETVKIVPPPTQGVSSSTKKFESVV